MVVKKARYSTRLTTESRAVITTNQAKAIGSPIVMIRTNAIKSMQNTLNLKFHNSFSLNEEIISKRNR